MTQRFWWRAMNRSFCCLEKGGSSREEALGENEPYSQAMREVVVSSVSQFPIL